MVDVDRAVIARFKKHGKNFEILADCDMALDFKKGKNIDILDALASKGIFTDVKKGFKATEKDLNEIFGINDVNEIAKIIIKEG